MYFQKTYYVLSYDQARRYIADIKYNDMRQEFSLRKLN